MWIVTGYVASVMEYINWELHVRDQYKVTSYKEYTEEWI